MRARSGPVERKLLFVLLGLVALSITGPAVFLSLSHRSLSDAPLPNLLAGAQVRPSPTILFAVLSDGIAGREHRDAIRRTWGRRVSEGSELRFFSPYSNQAGEETHLAKEAAAMDDLQILDTKRATLTSNPSFVALCLFRWAQRYSSHDFILKLRSDVYVSVPRLERLLVRVAPTPPYRRLYIGHLIEYGQFGPWRGPAGHKWTIGEDEYPYSNYPPFCASSAYLLSRDLVDALSGCLPRWSLWCSPTDGFEGCSFGKQCMFRPVRFEGVTVGGIVLARLGDAGETLDLFCTGQVCTREIATRWASKIASSALFVHRSTGDEGCVDDFVTANAVSPMNMDSYWAGGEAEPANESVCSGAQDISPGHLT